MHPLIGLAQLLGVGLVLYLIALIVYTAWGLTHPHRQTYASALARNLPGDPSELDTPIPFEEHTVAGTRGDLALWSLVGKNPNGVVVVMTHGWGSSRQGGLKRLGPIIENASRVIIWDLPGHGDSDGITHLGSTECADLACVLEYCQSESPIVLYGWSMGAGVSLAFAQRFPGEHRIIGIICESPYVLSLTPARNVIRLRGVPHRLNLMPSMMLLGTRFGVGPFWRGFARDDIAKGIDIPILILHGDHDPVCPMDDAEQIALAAPRSELVQIEGGGHNNLWTDEVFCTQMGKAIKPFVSGLIQTSQIGSPARP